MTAIISSPYGGRLCNAYSTWAEVDSYIRATCVFFTPWTDATSIQGSALIIRASLNIDALNWEGEKFFYDQAMEFPRRQEGEEFELYPRGTAIGDTLSLFESDEYLRQQQINLKKAVAEQALYLASNGGRPPYRQEQFQGVVGVSRSARVGASYSFGGPDRVLCPDAFDYLRHYAGSIRVRRG